MARSARAGACEHLNMRFVTFDEEPVLQDRVRRPLTCDDCNAILGPLGSRFSLQDGLELLFRFRKVNHAKVRRA